MNELELTISSIKMQVFREIYNINIGYERGTIFKELDKPWGEKYGMSSKCCM